MSVCILCTLQCVSIYVNIRCVRALLHVMVSLHMDMFVLCVQQHVRKCACVCLCVWNTGSSGNLIKNDSTKSILRPLPHPSLHPLLQSGLGFTS